MRKIAAALLAAVPLVAAGQERGSWYVVFGIAGGNGQVTDAAGTSSFGQLLGGTPVALGFRLEAGATLTPTLLLGFDLAGVRAATNESYYQASVAIVNYDAMVTWFPAGRGFFVRGGGGVSSSSFSVSLASVSRSSDFLGLNLAAGLGYAFWLGDSFNLTVSLDGSGQWWGDHDGGTTGPRSSSFGALGVGFDWY